MNEAVHSNQSIRVWLSFQWDSEGNLGCYVLSPHLGVKFCDVFPRAWSGAAAAGCYHAYQQCVWRSSRGRRCREPDAALASLYQPLSRVSDQFRWTDPPEITWRQTGASSLRRACGYCGSSMANTGSNCLNYQIFQNNFPVFFLI